MDSVLTGVEDHNATFKTVCSHGTLGHNIVNSVSSIFSSLINFVGATFNSLILKSVSCENICHIIVLIDFCLPKLTDLTLPDAHLEMV